MNALPLVVVALCVMAIAYRYYSAFIAAKVVALDDSRTAPAHTLRDGQHYEPTNKWVLFGHHLAAISGAIHDFVTLVPQSGGKADPWRRSHGMKSVLWPAPSDRSPSSSSLFART